MQRVLTILALFLSFAFARLEAGDLLPPASAFRDGQPVSTMRTLDEIEPRQPVSELPFVITNSGAYYVIHPLLGAATNHGITVRANHVLIDLGGFPLVGQPDSLSGILVDGPGPLTDVVIRNGVIRNWPGCGIAGSNAVDSQVFGITAFTNGQHGIALGGSAVVKDCIAMQNGGRGVTVAEGSTIENVTSRGNGERGIYASTASRIRECIVRENGSHGLEVVHDSRVIGCLARGNRNSGIVGDDGCSIYDTVSMANGFGTGGRGISVDADARIAGCLTKGNGGDGVNTGEGATILDCASRGNGGNGIAAQNYAVVRNCTCIGNQMDGIKVNNHCRIVDNNSGNNGTSPQASFAGIHVTGSGNRVQDNNVVNNDNTGIDVDATGNLIVRNSASLNTNDFTFVDGNNVGRRKGPGYLSNALGTDFFADAWSNFKNE